MYATISGMTSENYCKKFFEFKKIKLRYDFGKFILEQYVDREVKANVKKLCHRNRIK